MANMSKKDTYLNDTDGRDDGTEPSGHGSERFTGLCDAGLIKCTDGTTYLMSTMTNSPDGGLYTVRLANLASTLFECRDVLE